MNKYDKKETTIAALTKEKKPDCVAALIIEFDNAVERGLSFREAYHYAEITHFLKDHDGQNYLPKLRPELDSDEAVIQSIENDINEETYKREAHYLLRWYNLIRSWNVPFEWAFTIALQASMEEWEDDNDLDEVDAIISIDEIEDESIRDSLLIKFYVARNEGNGVRASLRIAYDEINQEAKRKALIQFLRLISNVQDNGNVNN